MRALVVALLASLLHETLSFGSIPVKALKSRAPATLCTSALRHQLRVRGLRGGGAPRMATTLYVKQAADGSGGLGDCPFSQKAHMALKLRGVDFKCEFINLADKPDWYLQINEKGSVPTLKVEGGPTITDSDEIVRFACGQEEPKLLGLAGEDEAGGLATAVWKAFATLMKNKDEAEEGALVDKLRKAVKDLDSFISSSKTGFLVADRPAAIDCKTGPFLLHASVALPHYKKVDPFEGAPAVKGYLEKLQGLKEFQETSYPPAVIVAGWAKFFT